MVSLHIQRATKQTKNRATRAIDLVQGTYHQILTKIMVVAFALALTGCTSIQLISDYDPEIDRGASQIQRSVTSFLLTMKDKAGTDDAAYENNQDFYVGIKTEMRAVRLRASSQPKNGITVRALDTVRDNLTTLEERHKAGFQKNGETVPGINPFFIDPALDTIEQQIGAILVLERAKARGEDG